jgi:hypothetical protein
VEHPPSDDFAIEGIFEFLTARLIVKDAEIKGRASCVKGACRPICELCKVEEKRSLDLVLIGSGLAPGRLRNS